MRTWIPCVKLEFVEQNCGAVLVVAESADPKLVAQVVEAVEAETEVAASRASDPVTQKLLRLDAARVRATLDALAAPSGNVEPEVLRTGAGFNTPPIGGEFDR